MEEVNALCKTRSVACHEDKSACPDMLTARLPLAIAEASNLQFPF